MSSSVENYLDKILSLMKQKISQNSNLFFKCKYNVFHQAKSYCKDCQSFICNKCLNNHDESHKILSLEEIINYFNDNISIYKDLSNGKMPEIKTEQKLDENLEQSCIKEVDNLINKLISLKKKMLKFSNLKKNLLEKYNLKEGNVILLEEKIKDNDEAEEKLEMEPLNLKEVKEIHGLIKYEKKNL